MKRTPAPTTAFAPVLVLGHVVDAIVIGGSAGAVDALSTLIPALPKGLTVPVFIVLHLPANRASLLVEIFERRCALAVHEAQDKEPALPGSVYFAPPGYHLLVDRGPQMSLSVDDPVNFSRPAIDVLFESAADLYGERLMGIVLTGANQDGAAGLHAVRRAGGATVVQDPSTAQMALMPEAALALGPVDAVLGLPGIADLLKGLRADGSPGPGQAP